MSAKETSRSSGSSPDSREVELAIGTPSVDPQPGDVKASGDTLVEWQQRYAAVCI